MTTLKKYWKAILAGIGLVIALLLGRTISNERVKKRVEEIRDEVKEIELSREQSKRVLEESREEEAQVRARIQDRRERARRRREKAEQIGKGMLILLLILGGLILSEVTVQAAEDPSNIPTDYDTLLKKYLELVDLAETYRKMYEEAEKDYEAAERDNELLLKQIDRLQAELEIRIANEERLQKRVDELLDTIMKLLRGRNIDIKGGVGAKYDPRKGLTPPELFAYVALEWSLLGQ